MFNIYEEEGEDCAKNSNLYQLFKRVQHPQLQDTIKALKVRFDIEGLTYTQAPNHLMATVSELPEYHLCTRFPLLGLRESVVGEEDLLTSK